MVDSHCHLDRCADGALERALEAGVRRVVTVGMEGRSIDAALAAARASEAVFAIVGRHPNEAGGFTDADLEAIRGAAAAEPRVRAIGETGLDYYRDSAPPADQMRAFEAQLALARELSIPVVIHTRDASTDTLATLARWPDLAVVMHCFSMPERVEECVERGYYCSFAGNVTYPKAVELQSAVLAVPDELLLVETDSPYLAPQPVRGKPNEPANVVATAEHVARLRGMSYADLETLVEQNAARAFRW